jgi:biopolymer transport protein TolQ
MLYIFASMQPFIGAYQQSDLLGKLIIWFLIALSMICWILLIYKIWEARKVTYFSNRVSILVKKNKEQILHLEAAQFAPFMPAHLPHPFPRIYFGVKDKAIEILNKKIFFLGKTDGASEVYLTLNDLEMLEQSISSTVSEQYKILEKNLFLLSTIYTLAPLLGLLGTVWGILVTFASLNGGAASASNAAVLAGISTALSTTVMGLIIAIPALIAYNYLRNYLKHFSADMEGFLYQLLSILELQYRKADLS